jgi:NADH:ubiquinone oxidoreductase subunit C
MVEMARENEIVESLRARLGKDLIEAKVQKPRRVFAIVTSSALPNTVEFLKDNFDMRHVSTMTGVDQGKEIGVYVHLMGARRSDSPHEIVLSLKATTPKTEAKLPSITSIIPGAALYEREVHDMFGVVFEGHPDLLPLILPDGWPPGVYPLRKELTLDLIRGEIATTQGGDS